MELSPTIQAGIKKGIIELSEDGSRINYIYLNQTDQFVYAFNKVLAETYISLIETYNYPIQRIDIYVKVKNKTKRDEYDIVVYDDDSKRKPIIIVECKGNNVSDVQLRRVIDRFLVQKNVFSETVKFFFLTNGIKKEFYKIDTKKRTYELISSIPFFGKDIPLYRYVKGGRLQDENADNTPIKQEYFDLEIISESNLKQIFNNICEELGKEGVFNVVDELNKLLLCKIVDERKSRKNGEPYDFQIIDISSSDDTDREKKINLALYKRVLALYDEGRRYEHELFDDDIRLTPKCVRIVVDYLQGVNLTMMDSLILGRAFENIHRLGYRLGKIITPSNVVKFIVDTLPLFRDCKIIDTSCGSGGYLIYAFDKLRKQGNCSIDTNNIFGVEIDPQIARIAKINMILRNINTIRVIRNDGLLNADILAKETMNSSFQYGTFDFAITTPPFGITYPENVAYFDNDWLSDDDSQKSKVYKSPRVEYLFLEQNFKFLREGGFLAIIIPDVLLYNQYIQNVILRCFRIVAIISLPIDTFKPFAVIKCSVLVLQKMTEHQRNDYLSTVSKLQDDIKRETNFTKRISEIENAKKAKLRNHDGFINNTGLTYKKEIERTDVFKLWKNNVISDYNNQISSFKNELNSLLLQREKNELWNYPIFMSIISNNDFDIVSDELRQFINSILTNDSYHYFGKMDNIFLVDKNDLEQNWNPNLYKNRTRFKSEVKLSEIAIINPITILPQLHSDDVISYVASNSFNAEDGSLKMDSVMSVAESKRFRLFKNGDILLSRINRNLATIHEAKNGFGFCSYDYFVIRPKDESLLSVDYLSIMLKDERVLQTTKVIRESNFLPKYILENIMIPLPSLSVQNEIVKIYNSALTKRNKKLQEAEEVIELAKKQISTMIK